MTQEYIGTKIVTAWPQEKDGKPGYGVKYSGGYTSWSPKEAFEESYIAIGHVSGKPAFIQRLIGERAQLRDNTEKLLRFIESGAFKALECEEGKSLLLTQNEIMQELLAVLDKRIALLV
jgi:hypothetical protein